MALNQALYAASLVTFTFGALTFSLLAVLYWRGKRRAPVLGALTLALAVSFVLNLALQFFDSAALAGALSVVTSLLPALIFQLCCGTRRGWRWMAIGFYGVSLMLGWFMPAAALAAGAGLGLAAQIFSKGGLDRRGRHYRGWMAAILAGIVCVSVVQAVFYPGPFFSLLPDYLVLGLFSVALYYEERLIFFDLVIKRGTMFVVGFLAAVAGLAVFASQRLESMEIWIGALAIMPLWMVAPWVSRRLGNFVDRAWLGRRYSTEEAEQKFGQDVQAAGSERPDGAPFLSDDHRLLRSLERTLEVVLQNVRFREREQKLRMLASRAELKALRAQINPHFLFNALNAIAGLIGSDPRLADETIERLARVFRYALSKSETEWVRLEEEMEFIEAYLGIEQARFGKRLSVKVEIGEDCGAVPIPAVSIQPLIENAIRHGVSPMEGPGVVEVRANLRAGMLRVEVYDNGHGLPSGFSIGDGGHGMKNIADRLAGYYGGAARLWWKNGGNGNRVFLEIPVAGAAAAQVRNDARTDRG